MTTTTTEPLQQRQPQQRHYDHDNSDANNNDDNNNDNKIQQQQPHSVNSDLNGAPDQSIVQATINLFADMRLSKPATLLAVSRGVRHAHASTDVTTGDYS